MIASLALVAGLCCATLAHAGADCSITSVGLNFGNYDPLGSQPDDVATNITVTCVHVPPSATNVSYTISISNGLHGSGAATRNMAAPGSQLGYNVFDDSARTRIWGTGTGGTVVAAGSLNVGPGVGNRTRSATHVIYGRIPGLQDVAAGTYLDTLLLTLTY